MELQEAVFAIKRDFDILNEKIREAEKKFPQLIIELTRHTHHEPKLELRFNDGDEVGSDFKD